jgi:NAD(P)-dependent dehydrogenase (short-subunit alcohol dehydrogenase family)
MLRLTDKRAIVLGCGGKNNIGQAIARRFTADGATLVVAGRKESGQAAKHRRQCDVLLGHLFFAEKAIVSTPENVNLPMGNAPAILGLAKEIPVTAGMISSNIGGD